MNFLFSMSDAEDFSFNVGGSFPPPTPPEPPAPVEEKTYGIVIIDVPGTRTSRAGIGTYVQEEVN